MARSAYIELIEIVKSKDGYMYFEKAGQPAGGAWIVKVDNKEAIFFSNGKGFPKLDRLYIPKIDKPKHYQDYTFNLIENAEEILLSYLKNIF